MSGANYVAMEKNVCPICCTQFETNAILLHKQLKNIPEEATVTGYSLCPDCKARSEEYIALVECDPTRSNVSVNKAKMQDVHRTGRLIHIRRSVAERLFTGIDTSIPMMWIDPEVWEKIVGLMPKE